MANLIEIAIGLTQVLRVSAQPEPLGIDLRGQSPAEARFLVKKVLDECLDADLSLALVCVDPAIGAFEHRGISVEISNVLDRRIEFYREPPKRLR